MYTVRVTDHFFIAHSLNHPSFGKAANLHGATYVVDLILSSDKLLETNIVIDIDIATRILKKCLEKYSFTNLDNNPDLENALTTTEFLSKLIVEKFLEHAKNENVDLKNISSIKVILNESHVASASFEKHL